jgi:xanthine dehydrogenase YagS FAD-binding subunit
VNPSDTAPALVALDATFVVRRGGRELEIPAEEFFVGPAVDIERMTVLEPGDLLTAVRLPAQWAGAQSYFEKSRDRQVWDFALGSVASVARVQGGVVEDLRVVVNGMAPTPVRLTAVETAVRGQAVTEAIAEAAGQLAIQGVRPLAHNGYKVALLKNLVKRAIRGIET